MPAVLSSYLIVGQESSDLEWGTIPEWITALFAGLALLAVLAAVGQLRLHNRQLHRELESQYLQRFWNVWDARTSKFKRTGKIRDAGSAWVQDYLTLSNDQVELRQRGRVTDNTWDFWARDIIRFCHAYPELVDEANRNYPALSHLLSHPGAIHATVNQKVQVYDPLEWSRNKRRMQGLSG